MSDPVFFASHFRIKEGGRDAVMQAAHDVADQLQEDKPRTLLFMIYADDGDVISFLHAFPDADSMDAHVVGASERASTIRDYVEPLGWEVYGRPNADALENIRKGAAASGAPFSVHPAYVAGFLRLPPA